MHSFLATVDKLLHGFFEYIAIILQIYKEDGVESTEKWRLILVVVIVMETDCEEDAFIRTIQIPTYR